MFLGGEVVAVNMKESALSVPFAQIIGILFDFFFS